FPAQTNYVNRVALQIGDDAYSKPVYFVNQLRIPIPEHRLAERTRETPNQLGFVTLRNEYLKTVGVLGIPPLCAHDRHAACRSDRAAILSQLLREKLNEVARLLVVGDAPLLLHLRPLDALKRNDNSDTDDGDHNPNDEAL